MPGDAPELRPEGEEQPATPPPADPLAENLGDTGAPALRNEGDTEAPLVPLDPAPEIDPEEPVVLNPQPSRFRRMLNSARNVYNQINIRSSIRKAYDTKVKKIVLGTVAGAAILAGGIYTISKLTSSTEQPQPENKLASKYIETSVTKGVHAKTPAAYQSTAGIMDFYSNAKGQKLSDLEKYLFASCANSDGIEEITEKDLSEYKKVWSPSYDAAKPSSEAKAGFEYKSPVYVFDSKEQADKLDSIVERHAKAKQETLKREGRNIEVKNNDAWKLWCRDYAANKFGAGKISGTDQNGKEVKDATYITNSAIESYDNFMKGVEAALGGK